MTGVAAFTAPGAPQAHRFEGRSTVVGARAPVPLKHCALMHDSQSEPRHLEVKPSTRGARRRRSLRRGIDLWHTDTLARTRARPRVALLTLTIADADPMAAQGQIRRFWTEFRT